jgi:hypothetical protein
MKKTQDEDIFVEEGGEDTNYENPEEEKYETNKDEEMKDFFDNENEEESF